MLSVGDNIFLYIFSASLLALCVLSIVKKRFLEFFFPAILFLPDYYGLEISYFLPLLSVKRIIYIVLFIYVLALYRKEIIPRIKSFRLNAATVFILLYFTARLITNLHYVSVYGQAVKTIFVIFFEQALLLVAVLIIAPTKEECISVIKAIVFSSVILFIHGLLESFTGLRPANSLWTVHRYMLNEYYVRAGLLRAAGTFGLPTYFGNFCVMMMPLILFLYEHFRKKIYLVIAALDVFACLHSGSRSSFLFILVAAFGCFLLHLRNSKRIIEFIKNTVAIVLALVIIVFGLSLISQKYQHYYKSFGKSLLNVIGFDYNLDEEASENVAQFGSNKNGTMSRAAQFSGISYVAGINPVWGLGSGAQTRGDIQYFYKGMWRHVFTYDVGYVEVFCDEGLWGWFGYLSLFISLFIVLLSKRYIKKDSCLSQYLIVSTVIYLLCLLSSSNMSYFLFTFVVLIISSSKREEAAHL